MKYLIRRSSGYCISKEPPCKGSYKDEVYYVDKRHFATPEGAGYGSVKWWYEKGTNHRVEDGCICRDMSISTWFVDIDDLLPFVKENGRCVVFYERRQPVVEIYDDLRE